MSDEWMKWPERLPLVWYVVSVYSIYLAVSMRKFGIIRHLKFFSMVALPKLDKIELDERETIDLV
jgi:hypothetical protein